MLEPERLAWIQEQARKKAGCDRRVEYYAEPRIIIMDIEEEYDSSEADWFVTYSLVEACFGLLNEEEYAAYQTLCPMKTHEQREIKKYWRLNRLFYGIGEKAENKEDMNRTITEKSVELLPKRPETMDFYSRYVDRLYDGAKSIAYAAFSQRN